MAAEKVTVMVLKVDLQCSSCYKKTKKTLCKFPQIRDQIYNEKANTVTVTVVCCSPEKIRDKLCCRGGKAIKSIEILDSSKKEPKQADKPKEPEKPKQADKPKEPEKPKAPENKKVTIMDPNSGGKPAEAQKPTDAAGKPKDSGKPKEGDKPKSNMKPKSDGGAAEKPKEGPKPEPAKNPGMVMNPIPVQQARGPEPVAQGVPSVFPYVGPSYDGYAAGPYYHGYGYPVPPPQPCYEGYYGNEYGGYGYGHGHGSRVTRTDAGYFTEEEPGCSIM